ncbi:hypothetical protein ACVR05_07020 [Streptococcus caprae]|uniref:Uncharacterized protein n=1 Tax=Streptococcus caprae TaxID=1640501 RepID=A0ABV8CVQ1_9STRE
MSWFEDFSKHVNQFMSDVGNDLVDSYETLQKKAIQLEKTLEKAYVTYTLAPVKIRECYILRKDFQDKLHKTATTTKSNLSAINSQIGSESDIIQGQFSKKISGSVSDFIKGYDDI